MIRLTLFVVCFACIISCSKDDTSLDNTQETEQEILAAQLADSLTIAYNDNSVDELTSILEYWYINSVPNERSDIETDEELDIYKVFTQIYNPFDIGRLGEHEWGTYMYAGLKYVIVQNKLYFDYNFNVQDTFKIDSLPDFRPDVYFSGCKVLFLTDTYKAAINSFLGSEFTQTISTELKATFVPVDDSYSRMQFLNQKLAILPGHWGNYWHIETHPYVSSIHFDSERKNARVDFRVGYMFGEAFLQKDDHNWTLVSSSINAIE